MFKLEGIIQIYKCIHTLTNVKPSDMSISIVGHHDVKAAECFHVNNNSRLCIATTIRKWLLPLLDRAYKWQPRITKLKYYWNSTVKLCYIKFIVRLVMANHSLYRQFIHLVFDLIFLYNSKARSTIIWHYYFLVVTCLIHSVSP